jgi:hypothetical protein
LMQLRRSRPNLTECLTPWQKRTPRKRSKNEGVGGTSVYMREGTSSRVMAVDRPYGKFYDFYSVRPEYFGYILVSRSGHYCLALENTVNYPLFSIQRRKFLDYLRN